MCNTPNKKRYSKMGALYALMHAEEMHNEYRPKRCYKCEDCKSYHLTSMALDVYEAIQKAEISKVAKAIQKKQPKNIEVVKTKPQVKVKQPRLQLKIVQRAVQLA